jgi:thiol-disulfide isomerase/thioredoxin
MKVLKFGAVWCSGCLVMKPRWEELEAELNWLKTEYYDVDENKDLVKKYNITDYPCFIFLNKAGEEIKRLYGEIEKNKLIQIIEELKEL